VNAGDKGLVGVSYRLLRLHHLNRVSDSEAKAVARLSKLPIERLTDLRAHSYLLCRAIQVQHCTVKLLAYASTQVTRSDSALLELAVSFEFVGPHSSALKQGNEERFRCCDGAAEAAGSSASVP
jgi:hypothetical protein